MGSIRVRPLPPNMRLGEGKNPLGPVTGKPVEVTSIIQTETSPLHYFITCNVLPSGFNSTHTIVVKIMAKDELDAYRQVMAASRKGREDVAE